MYQNNKDFIVVFRPFNMIGKSGAKPFIGTLVLFTTLKGQLDGFPIIRRDGPILGT
jgi:hypothetical protein